MKNKSINESLTALQQLQLEESWLQATRSTLNVRSTEDYLQLAFAENAKLDDPIDVIRQFYLCAKKGITPPAQLLMAVADSLENYNLALGELSLDECFSEKKRGKKHPLKQKLKDEERDRIYYFMWSQIKLAELENKQLSIWGAAKIAQEKFTPHITIETLEKGYINAKVSDIYKIAFDTMAEYAPENLISMLTWKRVEV